MGVRSLTSRVENPNSFLRFNKLQFFQELSNARPNDFRNCCFASFHSRLKIHLVSNEELRKREDKLLLSDLRICMLFFQLRFMA